MMLEDSLLSAFSLSIIDFIVSFVFISGIGVVLYLFPYLNKLGEISEEDKYWFLKIWKRVIIYDRYRRIITRIIDANGANFYIIW